MVLLFSRPQLSPCVALRCQVVVVPVVQVQQILRSCLCEVSRDPTVQLVVFVLGQGRRHPCRGADAVSHGPFYHRDSPFAVH